MWGDWLSADDIIAMLDDMAADAKNPAFAHHGHTHFYSGPDNDILKLISGFVWNNHACAKIRAAHMGALIIDDTRAGKFLTNFKGVGSAMIGGKGTYDYFLDHPFTDRSDIWDQARRPWRHASRLFALSAWGHVTTTISGTKRSGIYYTLEIPYSLNDKHPAPADLPFRDALRALFVPRQQPIDFINMLPFDRVAQAYTPTDWEKAHRLICLAEQRMALHEALAGVKPANIRKAFKESAEQVLTRPVEAYEYFLESREIYRVDRARMIKHTTAPPRKAALAPAMVRQAIRETTLREFALLALHAVRTELALLPPDQRPTIPAFSLVSGKIELKI